MTGHSKTVERIITELQARYKPDPYWTEADKARRLREVAAFLSDYDDGPLADMWHAFPHDYTSGYYPVVGDFARALKAYRSRADEREARETARQRMEALRAAQIAEREAYVEPSPEAKAKANELVAAFKARLAEDAGDPKRAEEMKARFRAVQAKDHSAILNGRLYRERPRFQKEDVA